MEAEREPMGPARLSRWGIRWRFAAFLVTTLIFLALSVTTLILVRRTIVAGARDHSVRSVRAVADRLETRLEKLGSPELEALLQGDPEQRALLLSSDPAIDQVLVLDGRGGVVAEARPQPAVRRPLPLAGQPALERLRAAAGQSGEGSYFTSAADGRRWLVAFARVGSTDWVAAASAPSSALLQPFISFMRDWLLLSAATVLVLFLLMLFFVDRLLVPIERLLRLTQKASPVMNTEAAAAENLLVLTRSVNRLMAYIDAFPGVLNLMLGLKDGYTSYHTRAVARYALEIGKALNLSGRQLGELECAALLHDIGKAGVPDLILKKPGTLTDEEWASIRLHSVLGAEVAAEAGFSPSITYAIRQHHERLDGSGYPDHLSGDQIGLYARIIAVADTYHAMTSNRPYRPARGIAEAKAELADGAGRKYDSRVVQAFLAALHESPPPAPAAGQKDARGSISSPSPA